MDPHYRPFFRHVLPICWVWLWWNLVRLTAFRLRCGRPVFVVVDKYGNVSIEYLGDAPKPDDLYTYEAPKVTSWDRLVPDREPLLPGEKGLGMRGRIIAGRAQLAVRPHPLTPAPFPGERGLAHTGQPRAPP